ncbi:MAG: nuclear transport factor 2 family protein [Flavobacteriales bacterium]
MTNLITNFYEAFADLEPEKMTSCYHPDVVFEDPAFGILRGEEAKSMWKMLLTSQKGKRFEVTFSDIQANDNEGSAKWEAQYTFSKTKRNVHNKVRAQFEFKDGLIIKHTDQFNLYKWSKQALGTSGALIGWSSFFKKKLQAQTNEQLKNFMIKL